MPQLRGTYLNRGAESKKPYLRITAGPQRGEYVHRLVLEAKLGRRLSAWEDAHHVNGDTLDNRPENLEAVPRDEHGRITRLNALMATL
jgi:hypothetical protein